ncbi:MAG: nucleotidyltransferase family protein [Verrucomicrobia bacterium]|nr:nucleotidyltransferase family protein [Verrucomicrobiota bacterium]
MKAVILAAGKGTRMRNLTAEVPKPMLQVQGKPILEHIIEGLTSAGILEICVITGYCADSIEDYFRDGSRWGATLHFERQAVQDGTGKAPELAKTFLADDPFVLTYGDILVKPETYQAMRERFESGEYSGLVSVTPGQDVTQGGINFFDEQFHLQKIVEKPSQAEVARFREIGWLKDGQPVWYNAGIYIFRPALFEFTTTLKKSPRGEYELPDAITAMLDAGHRITGLEIAGRWVDVRDPEVLETLQTATDPL